MLKEWRLERDADRMAPLITDDATATGRPSGAMAGELAGADGGSRPAVSTRAWLRWFVLSGVFWGVVGLALTVLAPKILTDLHPIHSLRMMLPMSWRVSASDDRLCLPLTPEQLQLIAPPPPAGAPAG
jgi:hypothetical protein